MRIFYTELPPGFAGPFICRGRSPGALSAAAWSLLARALEREFGLDGLPAAALTDSGAPYFPSRPDIRFSLSHTRPAVLCAVGGRGKPCLRFENLVKLMLIRISDLFRDVGNFQIGVDK